MRSPYADKYGSFKLDDDLLTKLEEVPEENWSSLLVEYFPPETVESPYNLSAFVYQRYPRNSRLDLPVLILDYIVEYRRRWDPDEVACFLLEVAEDHAQFMGDTRWLEAVNMPDMLDWPHTYQMIWEMFWEGHAALILALIDHYDWRQFFSQQLREGLEGQGKEKSPEYYFRYLVAKQFDDGMLASDPDFSLAEGLRAAFRDAEEGRHYDAIAGLLAFHDAESKEFLLEVRRALTISYLAIGWRDLALEWISKALDHSPEDSELQSLQRQALGSDLGQIGKLREKLRANHPHLTDDSLEALTQAEFLFHYYGKMLGDYSVLVSSFGRALEIQLRQVLLPNLRQWIHRHGKANREGRRFISAGARRIYADADESQFTLGVWAEFFDQPWNLESHKAPDQFYYCLLQEGVKSRDYQPLTILGRSLTRFKELRNRAAHEAFRDWDKVKEMRILLTERDLFRLAQPERVRKEK